MFLFMDVRRRLIPTFSVVLHKAKRQPVSEPFARKIIRLPIYVKVASALAVRAKARGDTSVIFVLRASAPVMLIEWLEDELAWDWSTAVFISRPWHDGQSFVDEYSD